MTTNQTNTITYDCQTEAATISAAPRFPKLFWAAAATFSVNVLVAAGVFLSPELRVTMYGQETNEYAMTAKPSPFTEVVDTKPARKVRRAERLHPVAFQEAPLIPEAVGSYVPASYASGDGVHLAVERMSEFPRLSAAVVKAERLTN